MTLIAYGSKATNVRRAVSAQERRYALDVSSPAPNRYARPGSAGSVGTPRLHPSQQRVLDVVCRIASDGWAVTVREAAREAGMASTGHAHEVLLDLEALGLLETCPRHTTRRGGWKPTSRGRDLSAWKEATR